MICNVASCERVVRGRGLCLLHYTRYRRTGNSEGVSITPRKSNKAECLEFYGWTVTDSGCWEWNGPRDKNRYGRVVRPGGGRMGVHRLAHETWVGPIPEGHVVRHKCDNPPCINPEHLETGTPKQNSRDMMERGRFKYAYGSQANGAKLREEQVLSLVEKAKQGFGRMTLAEEFGISEGAVRHILSGKSWGWLTGL